MTTTARTETTTKALTAKAAVKDVVETMSENLYNRFIDAFTDENETHVDSKRQPLVSDEQLEDTFKTIKKSIQEKLSDSKPVDTSPNDEDQQISRFQQWIIHYLKAPFQKWEKKTDEQENVNIVDDQEEAKADEQDDDEEDTEEDSSSDVEDDDEDDDEEDQVGNKVCFNQLNLMKF